MCLLLDTVMGRPVPVPGKAHGDHAAVLTTNARVSDSQFPMRLASSPAWLRQGESRLHCPSFQREVLFGPDSRDSNFPQSKPISLPATYPQRYSNRAQCGYHSLSRPDRRATAPPRLAASSRPGLQLSRGTPQRAGSARTLPAGHKRDTLTQTSSARSPPA